MARMLACTVTFNFANKFFLQNCITFSTDCFSAFWLDHLAFVPDGVSVNVIFEAERPPISAGSPSGGRTAFLTPMHPLYSTRPHGLVQAIFWQTCPDLDLGP